MSIDAATVKHIANLARLELKEQDIQKYSQQLSGILAWVEQLKELDTENVPPMTGARDMTMRLRTDEITDGGYQQDVLANAPDARQGFFGVPKVVE